MVMRDPRTQGNGKKADIVASRAGNRPGPCAAPAANVRHLLNVAGLSIVLGMLAAYVVGCATRSVGPAVPVVPELEQQAVAATLPGTPLLIRFHWRAREQEARYSGQGIARVEAPNRARLDLFGPRGEAYLSSVLTDGRLDVIPAGQTGGLPPPALLWSALGVFQPPEGAELVVAQQSKASMRLEYRDVTRDARWRFELEDGRLSSAQLEYAGRGRQTVELNGAGAKGIPDEARYRDWGAFVELTLTTEVIDAVESFPAEIWVLY